MGPHASPPADGPRSPGPWKTLSEFIPPAAPLPPPRPARRRWLPVVLFAATVTTLTVVGGAPYALMALVVLGSHEMGHYVACRYYGVPSTAPMFLPGIWPIGSFGAVIRIRGPIPHRRALFDIAAAGPIAGFVVALPLLLLGVWSAAPFDPVAAGAGGSYEFGKSLARLLSGLLLGRDGPLQANAAMRAGWLGMLVTSLNLFPVGQLDGGHVAYALSRRAHRALAHATLVGLALSVIYQVAVQRQLPAYLLWFAILLWMRDRHPPLLDESEPLGRRRRWVAALLLLLLALSFIPVPLRVALY